MINYPTSLDTLTNPTAGDKLNSPAHDVLHSDANDAIEALQAKVGIDGSQVASSVDYLLTRSPSVFGRTHIKGVEFKAASSSNSAIGTHDIYVCPAGRKAVVMNVLMYNSSAIGNIGYAISYVIGGTAFLLTSNSIASKTAANYAPSAMTMYCMSEGDVLRVETTTNNGMNIFARVVEVGSGTPVSTVAITTLAAGTNTVYTVPAGKTTLLLDESFEYSNGGRVYFLNSSGGSVSYSIHAVPSGGTADETNRYTTTSTMATGNKSSVVIPSVLTEGYSIVINAISGSGTSLVWSNILEI